MSALRLALFALLATAGCHRSLSDNRELCTRAATQYSKCVGELLGPEARAIVEDNDHDGVAACASDDQTVALYRKCLPETSCNAFMDCMTDYASATAP